MLKAIIDVIDSLDIKDIATQLEVFVNHVYLAVKRAVKSVRKSFKQWESLWSDLIWRTITLA